MFNYELIFITTLTNLIMTFYLINLQGEKPKLNFKDWYSEPYRDSHPNAPLFVPWVSGVVSA